MLEGYARHFLADINRWADDGFASIRRTWLRNAQGIGETISIEAAPGNDETTSVEGTFTGLDDAGRVIVETAVGRRVPVDAARALAARIRT